MKEEWLFPNAIIPVNVETTQALVVEIKRLIDVVGGMALECPNCEYHRQRAQRWRDEAYKQAGHPLPDQDGECKHCTDGCPACDARKLPKQEPVAWGVFEGNLHDMFFSQEEAQKMADLKGTHAEVRPLYTTPPQRTWVGLTKEERHEISMANRPYVADAMAAHEEELKRRNT